MIIHCNNNINLPCANIKFVSLRYQEHIGTHSNTRSVWGRPAASSEQYSEYVCIIRTVSELQCNKSVGPDGIPGVFLFKLKSIISYPFWILLRRSLDEGICCAVNPTTRES